MKASGFTLVELAVVMAIVGLLLGSLMYTLSAQSDQRAFEETRRRLEYAQELLEGYAIVNGRLPCPAISTSAGAESDTGGGACSTYFSGWLPAATIGFLPVDTSGFALDAWGGRIRYAVSGGTPVNSQTPRVCRPVSDTTPPVTPHFTNRDNLKANGLDCQPSDLLVCRSATGVTASTCGGAANQVTTQNLTVAIVFSTGKNGATGGIGIDEAANLNGDAVFVHHPATPPGAANGEFDDLMVWIPVGALYGRLVAAGVLP